MQSLNVQQSCFSRARADTERFRHSAKSFWGTEVVGAAAFAAIGFILTPPDASKIGQAAYPGVGIVLGFVLVFGSVFLWNLFRAPYRQRDEARVALQAIPGSPTTPILVEPQLFFSNLFCSDFGYGGEGNFGGLDVSKRYGYVSAIASAESEMTITRIALMLDGQENPAVRWNAREIGPGNYLCSFPVEIAKIVGVGRHEARIVAFASGKSWRSPDFMVEVPSR